MSITVAAQLLALIAAVSATIPVTNNDDNAEILDGADALVLAPEPTNIPVDIAVDPLPSTFLTENSDNEEYIYTLETCTEPPASIKICLSSIFSSIEAALTHVNSKLKLHEASIEYDMHHERTLLYSEISFVYKVKHIAESVSEVVNVDYYALYEQVKDLIIEKQDIYNAYNALEVQLNDILAQVEEVQANEYLIVQEHQSVQYAKWSIYSAISAILYEKIAVQEEVDDVEYVVAYLHQEVYRIYEKIDQLHKRQVWLASWEVKLYADLSGFQKEVKHFKDVEAGLYVHEKELYDEQARLLIEAKNVQEALEKLRAEYTYINKELVYIERYENLVKYIEEQVSANAHIFNSAYEEFTCEESLLKYEACSSAAAPAALPDTVAVATGPFVPALAP